MNRKIKRLSYDAVLDFSFVFFLIYFTRSMASTIPSLKWVSRFFKVLPMIIVVAQLTISKEKRISKKQTALLLLLTGYLLAFALIRTSNTKAYLSTLYLSLMVIMYTWSKDVTKVDCILERYELIMVIILSISLFFWLFGSMLHVISASGTIKTTWSGTDDLLEVPNYYYLYFEPQRGKFFSLGQINRNSAIFTEAPMCSFHIIMSLLVELFVRRKENKFRLGIILIALVTSVSMTGYICAAVALVLKYLNSNRKNSKLKKMIKMTSIPIAVILLMYVVRLFLAQRSGTASGNIRIDDFKAGYKAWRDNILFGNGYGNAYSYIQYMSGFRFNNQGFSNSIMQLLAYGGLYLFMPIFLAVICGIANFYGNKDRMAFLAIFVIMYTVTLVPFPPLSIFVFAWFTIKPLQSNAILCWR